MEKHITDWKDIASSYYEKSLSLAVLIVLFGFLVSPKMEIKPYKRVITVTKAIELPPELKEKIDRPDQDIKPQIQIVIDEDELSGDDEDIEVVETIATTKLDMEVEKAPPDQFGKTSRFQTYEKPPIALSPIKPKYPDFEKKMGIEGDVVVEVEVFKTGKVGQVNVVKSLTEGLDAAAVQAVKKWEFQPAESNGEPVSVWVSFPITFSLE